MAKDNQSVDTLATDFAAIPKERRQFRALLMANPNYFGNLKESPFAPIAPIEGDQTYETIGSVGFHPQSKRLDAVIYTTQQGGYDGSICSKGSTEFVRFYLSFDNGASWVDQGYAGVAVYDVPGVGSRLEYAVTVPCQPPEIICFFPNVLRARAILSWNQIPPADQPFWVPVWGAIHDTNIQVEPRYWLDWPQLVDEFKVKIPAKLSDLVDFTQPLKLAPKPALSVGQLQELYRGKGVEAKRYALPTVKKLLSGPVGKSFQNVASSSSLLETLGEELNQVIDTIYNSVDGSTYYEELDAVGFNPATSELVGVLRIKRPNGYSGGLCTQGSREYITFWADLDGSGSFETCLGTGSVQVYDIQQIPPEGLEYSVYLPVYFGDYQQTCQSGPRVIPIRAILSWASIAPCNAPDTAPIWGNHDDTHILLPPGQPVGSGDYQPLLENISTIDVCDIDPTTGLAGTDLQPFGAAIYIIGQIPGALTLSSPDRLRYKITYQPYDLLTQAVTGTPQTLTNDFAVTIESEVGPGIFAQTPLTQSVDAAGYYTYRDFGFASGNLRHIVAPYPDLLGVWYTGAPMTGAWRVSIEAYDPVTGVTYSAATNTCQDGTTRQSVVIALDELAPIVDIEITEFSTDGGVTFQPTTDCADLVVGVIIKGTYGVSDDHFGSLSIIVEPPVPANGAQVAIDGGAPGAGIAFPAVPNAGQAGTWTLDTTGMEPCGYVVQLNAYDRTIVSANGPWWTVMSQGFCLKAPAAN